MEDKIRDLLQPGNPGTTGLDRGEMLVRLSDATNSFFDDNPQIPTAVKTPLAISYAIEYLAALLASSVRDESKMTLVIDAACESFRSKAMVLREAIIAGENSRPN